MWGEGTPDNIRKIKIEIIEISGELWSADPIGKESKVMCEDKEAMGK